MVFHDSIIPRWCGRAEQRSASDQAPAKITFTQLCRHIETSERESVWAFASFRIFKVLAEFRVKRADVSQESVERALCPQIGEHIFVAHGAQCEGACRF